jgi:hypothetical protein
MRGFVAGLVVSAFFLGGLGVNCTAVEPNTRLGCALDIMRIEGTKGKT